MYLPLFKFLYIENKNDNGTPFLELFRGLRKLIMELEMSLGDDRYIENPGTDLVIFMYPHLTDGGTGVQRLHN